LAHALKTPLTVIITTTAQSDGPHGDPARGADGAAAGASLAPAYVRPAQVYRRADNVASLGIRRAVSSYRVRIGVTGHAGWNMSSGSRQDAQRKKCRTPQKYGSGTSGQRNQASSEFPHPGRQRQYPRKNVHIFPVAVLRRCRQAQDRLQGWQSSCGENL
jgi:hypothetical protein